MSSGEKIRVTISPDDCRIIGDVIPLKEKRSSVGGFLCRRLMKAFGRQYIAPGETALVPVDAFSRKRLEAFAQEQDIQIIQALFDRVKNGQHIPCSSLSEEKQELISRALGEKKWATLDDLLATEQKERRQTENSLDESDERKGCLARLMSIIPHPLRQILGTIVEHSDKETGFFERIFVTLRSRLVQLGLRGGIIVDEDKNVYLLCKNLSKIPIQLKKGLGIGRELFIPQGSRLTGKDFHQMLREKNVLRPGTPGEDYLLLNQNNQPTKKPKKAHSLALKVNKDRNLIPGKPKEKLFFPYDPEAESKKTLRENWIKQGIHRLVSLKEAIQNGYWVTETVGTFGFDDQGRDEKLLAVIQPTVLIGNGKNLRTSPIAHLNAPTLDASTVNGVTDWEIRLELNLRKARTLKKKLEILRTLSDIFIRNKDLYVQVNFYNRAAGKS